MKFLVDHAYILEAVFLALFLTSEILGAMKKVRANGVVQAIMNVFVATFSAADPKLKLVADALEQPKAPESPSDPNAKP